MVEDRLLRIAGSVEASGGASPHCGHRLMGGVCRKRRDVEGGQLADRLTSQHSILPVSTQREYTFAFHK